MKYTFARDRGAARVLCAGPVGAVRVAVAVTVHSCSAQVFNEFNARSIESRLNVFSGLLTNPIFLGVIVVTVGVQILVVEFGGKFTSTTGLSLVHWGWSALMAFGTTPVGVLMRFIPVSENPDSFADFYSSAYNVSVVVA